MEWLLTKLMVVKALVYDHSVRWYSNGDAAQHDLPGSHEVSKHRD